MMLALLAAGSATSARAQQQGSIPTNSQAPGADSDLDAILKAMAQTAQLKVANAGNLGGTVLLGSISDLNTALYYAEKEYYANLADRDRQYADEQDALAVLGMQDAAAGTSDSSIAGVSALKSDGTSTAVGFGYSSEIPDDYLNVVGTVEFPADNTWQSPLPGQIAVQEIGAALQAGMPSVAKRSDFTAVTPDGTAAVGEIENATLTRLPIFTSFTSGVTQLLPLPPGISGGTATSLSDNGLTIWGEGSRQAGGEDLVQWKASQPGPNPEFVATDIGSFPGAVGTYSAGCSSDGSKVVGFYEDQSFMIHSIQWTAAGGFVDLGANAPAGSNFGQAYACTSDGAYVVGTGADQVLGYIWSQSTGTLGYLSALTGLVYAVPQCVSGNGAFIGGVCYDASYSTPTATLWTSSGQPYNLQELLEVIGVDMTGRTLNQITSITANSDGTYLLAGDGSYNSKAAGFVVRIGIPVSDPGISTGPAAQTVNAGSDVALTVVASGSSALSYQWSFNGSPISGATGSTLSLSNVQAANGGTYQVVVTDSSGNQAASAVLTVNPASAGIGTQPVSQKVNTGSTVVFTVTPGGSIGSSLAKTGGNTSALTAVTTYQWQFNGVNLADGGAISGSAGPQLVITGTTSADDGDYSCTVSTGGVAVQSNSAALVVGSAPVPGFLVNISSRAFVGTGANILIGGFYVGGATSRSVLVQALGPALAGEGVPGVLQHPALTLYDSMGKVIFSNTGWGNSPVLLKAAASAYANPVLQPDSNDSEVLLTLPPGGYTAQVAGADGGTGVALCAIYQLP